MAKYTANSMSDVKFFNQQVGYYFFSKDSMKFFDTKIESELYKNNTFVTSENNFDGTKRLYTVRLYDPETADIETVGEFQGFTTKAAAKAFAMSYKKEE